VRHSLALGVVSQTRWETTPFHHERGPNPLRDSARNQTPRLPWTQGCLPGAALDSGRASNDRADRQYLQAHETRHWGDVRWQQQWETHLLTATVNVP